MVDMKKQYANRDSIKQGGPDQEDAEKSGGTPEVAPELKASNNVIRLVEASASFAVAVDPGKVQDAHDAVLAITDILEITEHPTGLLVKVALDFDVDPAGKIEILRNQIEKAVQPFILEASYQLQASKDDFGWGAATMGHRLF